MTWDTVKKIITIIFFAGLIITGLIYINKEADLARRRRPNTIRPLRLQSSAVSKPAEKKPIRFTLSRE